MKKSYLLFLVIVIFSSGCNREVKIFSIGEKKNHTKMEKVIYPELRKNSIVADKINNDILFKANEMKRNWKYTDEIEKIKFLSNYNIEFRKEEIISIRFDETVYLQESSRPYKEIKSITLNSDTGMEYSLSDFFKEKVNYKKVVNKYIKEYLFRENIDMVKDFNGIESEQEFYLTEDAIVIYYQPYIYTTRTYGALIIPIYFVEIKEIINKEYIELFIEK